MNLNRNWVRHHMNLKKIITDNGYLVNLNKNTIGFDIKHAYLGTILPHKQRGNHYHKEHIELFVCIKGQIHVELKGRFYVTSKTLHESDMILAKKNVLHTLKNKTEDVVYFIGFSNKIHNSKHKDTYV